MSSSSINVLVSTFHPYPTLSFHLPQSTNLSKIPTILNPILPLSHQSLSTSNGKTVNAQSKGSLLSLLKSQSHGCPHHQSRDFLTLRLVPKVLGGKGGFGSQLRAAGGRMSSQKTQNNDSCRDLSGRRLFTIKEAQKLAAAIAAEPERQAAKRKEAEERLEGLKKEIERLDKLVNGTDEMNLKKRRLNDNHLTIQSKEGIEKVRNATAVAMLKKRKKQQKKDHNTSVAPNDPADPNNNLSNSTIPPVDQDQAHLPVQTKTCSLPEVEGTDANLADPKPNVSSIDVAPVAAN